MDIEERLQQMESNINFLFTHLEKKSKLVRLIEVLRKTNEELSLECGKLVRAQASLFEVLAAEKSLTKRLQLRLNDEKNLTLLGKLSEISVLLCDADSLIDGLVADFQMKHLEV